MGNLSLYTSTSCVMTHRWRVVTRDRDKKSHYNLNYDSHQPSSLLPDRKNRKMCQVCVHCDVWICNNLHIPFTVTYFTEWFIYNLIHNGALMARCEKQSWQRKHIVLWIMFGHTKATHQSALYQIAKIERCGICSSRHLTYNCTDTHW